MPFKEVDLIDNCVLEWFIKVDVKMADRVLLDLRPESLHGKPLCDDRWRDVILVHRQTRIGQRSFRAYLPGE